MRTLLIIGISLLSMSCSNFLDVKPMGKLIPTEVEEYENLLNNLKTVDYYFLEGGSSYLATLGDNLKISENNAKHYFDISNSSISKYTSYTFQTPYYDPTTADAFWDKAYEAIGIFNVVIDGVNDVKTDQTESLAKQLIAQAKAARAWTYLNMAMIYGPVYDPNGANDVKTIPYRTTSEPLVANPDRATTAEIFEYAKQDIDDALAGIPENVSNPCRFGLPATYMLASYYYMFKRDWTHMLEYADLAWKEVIKQKGGEDAALYNYNNFTYGLDDSEESEEEERDPEIDEPLIGEDNLIGLSYHRENLMFRKPAYGGTGNLYPSDDFLASFDTEKDLRYDLFVLRENGYSGEINGEAFSDGIVRMYFRDEKMMDNEGFTTPILLLMRAEAYARMNKLTEALADLNLLRKYRYKGTTPEETDLENGSSLTQDQLLEEILKERRRELPIATFQRLLDLKRYSLDKGKSWCKTSVEHKIGEDIYSAAIDSDKFILPIPNTVIMLNPDWGLTPDNRVFDPVMYK